MVVCKMAAVGRTKDQRKVEGGETSENAKELEKLCRKNGIHQAYLMGGSMRGSVECKVAYTDRPQRVNGTSKAVTALFPKPSIPTLRTRKDKVTVEQSSSKRLSKESCSVQRPRCCSQDDGQLLGSGDLLRPTPCKLELDCESKMGLGCGLGGRCSSPSSTTQEICASLSPPDLVPEVPLDLYKRERRDSNGAVDDRGIPDTPIDPQPCSPLPFPKIPSPGTPPKTLVPEDGCGNNNEYSSEALSSASSSPLSSIPSPTGSLSSLFGATQDSRSPAHSVNGSSSNKNGSNSSINRSASCSSLASPSSSASTTAVSSAAATPTEEADIVCQWRECGSVVNPADLLEHLRIQHVDTQKDGEKFVCEWESCKVAGKASCSMSWLERHVVTHGGHKPFRCIVPNCGARFPTQVALQRHVNGHFASEGQSSNSRSSRPRGEESSGRVVRRRNKQKRGRPQCVKNADFFDIGIMDGLRERLLDLTEKTQMDLNGSGHNVTFQGMVKARRVDENGKESVLLGWTPENVLEDSWLATSQVDSLWQRALPFTHHSASSVTDIHPSLYSRHRFRKHRRK